MNPLIPLWAASVAGAASLFAAGFLLARFRRNAEQRAMSERLGKLQAELEHTQLGYSVQSREVEHLSDRVQRAEQSAAELHDALSQARAECVRLAKELKRHTFATERAAALERENAMLIAQVRARALTSTEAAAAELRTKLEHEETRSSRLQSELRELKTVERTPQVQKKLAELQERMDEALEAKARFENLTRTLEAEASSAAPHEDSATGARRLKREQRERGAWARALAERVSQLEANAKENILLKKQRDALTAELQRMREEQMRASGIPQAPGAAPRSFAPVPLQSGIAPRMAALEEGSLEGDAPMLDDHAPGAIHSG